jgi:hypothetical protein
MHMQTNNSILGEGKYASASIAQDSIQSQILLTRAKWTATMHKTKPFLLWLRLLVCILRP